MKCQPVEKKWKKLAIYGILIIGFGLAGRVAASGLSGTISANTTLTLVSSTSTLNYVGFPDWSDTIAYLQVGCGGVYLNQTQSNIWYEKTCSTISLKNTNLTAAYAYSIIYDATSTGKLTEISANTAIIAATPGEPTTTTDNISQIRLIVEEFYLLIIHFGQILIVIWFAWNVFKKIFGY